MFLLTDYLNLIPNETGRLVVLDTLTALSDRTGWPLLRVLQFVIKNTQAYQPTLKGTSTGKALRARNARRVRR